VRRPFGATLPSDNEQEILVKTTLMTFNDANLTGSYSVKDDEKRIRFDLKFVKEDDVWKILGINMNYKEE
jgi:hypothetical protein